MIDYYGEYSTHIEPIFFKIFCAATIEQNPYDLQRDQLDDVWSKQICHAEQKNEKFVVLAIFNGFIVLKTTLN